MAVSQESGLGMRETLKSIASAETNVEMKIIIQEMVWLINEWKSFGYAMERQSIFGPSEIELIKAAEKMWNMPEVLRDVATELENAQQINWKIKKAISYPAWLLAFTVVAVAILLIFVIPTVVELYGDPSKLPWITKFMISASEFFQKSRWMMILTIFGVIMWFHILYSQVLEFKKNVDFILLKIPSISDTIKTFYMYNFSKLFWDFGKAWVSPVDALEQMRKIFDNYTYKTKMLSMKTDLENGFSISDSVEWSWLFDPILIQIITVWEKTWNLSNILLTMSNFYRYQLTRKIDWLTALIEPIMMWVIACVIWMVVASIFLPMWGLLEQMWW